jgi:hypothetical protein
MLTPKQVVLPFAVKSESREEPFSVETESAAIFALSELECKNNGSNNAAEKCDFILKVGYPLWFIAKDNFTYVFDGLNRMHHHWTYYEAPQAEFKLEDFDFLFRIREEYTQFLVNYQKKFLRQARSNKKLLCEGLIEDHTLLDELGSYRKEATEVSSSSPGLLLPVLDEKKIISIIDQIETLQLSFKEKTEKFKKLLELISNTTKGYIEGFNFESKATSEEAEAKIKAQKEIINPKIEKLINNYKKQVDRLEKSTNKEQQPLENQKNRLEKNIKETETNIEHYNKQMDIQSQKDNKRSVDSLKKKLKQEKRELDDLQKQQKTIETQLKTVMEQKIHESSKLKDEFDRAVQIERQPIVALETIRDEKQERLQQESIKLETLTQPVLDDLNQLVEEWENYVTKMKLLGLKTDHELLKDNTIVYVPFYIVAYSKADSKNKRYLFFAPSIVGSLGFSSKLKGFLGRAKIKDLFTDRFKAIPLLGEELQSMISSSNRDFETQIDAVLQTNNLLDMKLLLKDGLLLLKEEGWLSESDYQTILSAI